MSARRGSRPRLHVLGGGTWQVPTIRLARTMGFEVLVTDLYARRPGYACADHHEIADIADAEATLDVARNYAVDGIVCDTTDVGVPTMAHVAEALGLSGLPVEVALRFTRKDLMREATNRVVPRPVVYGTARDRRTARETAARVGYPVMVKPVDGQSSRGVTLVRSEESLDAAYDDASSRSRSGLVIVEEVLHGTEVTVEGIMVDGEYRMTALSDKTHFVDRPAVARRITYPADLSAAFTHEIERINESVVRALGMRDFGVTHAEYFVNGSEIALVEIAARGGGSRIHSDIVPAMSGLDVPRTYLSRVIGRPKVYRHRPRHGAATLEFLDLPAGRVEAIRGLRAARAIEGVHEIMLEFREGEEISRATDDRTRPGLMVLFGRDRRHLSEISDAVHATLAIEMAAHV